MNDSTFRLVVPSSVVSNTLSAVLTSAFHVLSSFVRINITFCLVCTLNGILLSDAAPDSWTFSALWCSYWLYIFFPSGQREYVCAATGLPLVCILSQFWEFWYLLRSNYFSQSWHPGNSILRLLVSLGKLQFILYPWASHSLSWAISGVF